MKTFVLNVPKDASVTVEAGRIVIGVNDPSAAFPLSDVLTLHCASGAPAENNEANASYTLRQGKRGFLQVEHI